MPPLPTLEASLWDATTRFDRAAMDALLAPDAFEFGRSGRRYTRADLLDTAPSDINATLHDLTVTDLSDTIALVTYRTDENGTWSNRASLWDRRSGTWQLRFHQGTPTQAPQ